MTQQGDAVQEAVGEAVPVCAGCDEREAAVVKGQNPTKAGSTAIVRDVHEDHLDVVVVLL
jgi:hypothetical protein